MHSLKFVCLLTSLIACFSLQIYELKAFQYPPIKGIKMVSYKAVETSEKVIVGIECRTSNNPGCAQVDIPMLWDKFFKDDILNKIPCKSSNEVIALYCDYEGDFTKPYKVVIGCPVSSVDTLPEGMVSKTIPASLCACFEAQGEFPKSVIEMWESIWTLPLVRTYTCDYEVYGDKFGNGTPPQVDIFIGIYE